MITQWVNPDSASPKIVPGDDGDDSLRRAVLARLIADPSISTRHIGVATASGRVTLSGYVTSNAQKDAANAATRGVKGVEQLADEVMVALPCSPAIGRARTLQPGVGL